jgi:hypothetical protein
MQVPSLPPLLFPLARDNKSRLTSFSSFSDPANRAKTDGVQAPVESLAQDGLQMGGEDVHHPEHSSLEHMPFKLDFSELMVPSDLDFLKYFEPSLNLP